MYKWHIDLQDSLSSQKVPTVPLGQWQVKASHGMISLGVSSQEPPCLHGNESHVVTATKS